ncbi:universal stress protein [Actinomadura coerulea]|uniref:Nucleotide-binding universal stress UspA family protein n=1 Tax=Actinomadura coerulea TaxID=46159 RepID=A0A7X0G0H8_9ACTN|nr:universal stress protein [Actinomadura coerulea]MBB6396460.1 nucleotide-binding universal stress UspA family protein [Actinomadura coerulea]GGQ06044.1 universal stress protein A [Actinomadura coerulea]
MRPFEYGVDGPKVIVAGVDGSETSLRAGAYAWGLARRAGARLVVVHVAPVASMGTLTPGGAAALRETAEEVSAQIRRELEAAAGREQVRYDFVTELGDPYTVLARVADESRADAVIVGASAQAGHRIIGSVAVRLVKAGRWPVTVVP